MKRNLWPYAIIAYFVVFITGMAAWITFAMGHDDQLVRRDYYEHEIEYQNQIDRVARTGALGTGASVIYDPRTQTIQIRLPPGTDQSAAQGRVHFYRPSDARLDQKLDLKLAADGTHQMDVSKLRSGFWKVFLSWKALGQEYYLEQPLVLYSR
jgi:nitrogen fixation protein FixH